MKQENRKAAWRRPSVIFVSFLFLAGFTAGVLIASDFGASSEADYSSSSAVRMVPLGQYAPQNITLVIGVNNTVTWVNGDVVSHSVTADSGLFNSGLLSPKQRWSFTFDSPGVYYYHCSVHPWMKGVVTVLEQ